MSTTRKSLYLSDVTEEQWGFLLPCLTLMREDAPQREYSLRDLFNALRYVVRTGVQWRYLPNDFPPWTAVYQQARRWLSAGVFEDIVHDLRVIELFLNGRHDDPSAVMLDALTLQSTTESGSRAGYDGANKKQGSKIHMLVCVVAVNSFSETRVSKIYGGDMAAMGTLGGRSLLIQFSRAKFGKMQLLGVVSRSLPGCQWFLHVVV